MASIKQLAASRTFLAEEPNERHRGPFDLQTTTPEPFDNVVFHVLNIKRQLHDDPAKLSFQDRAAYIQQLGTYMQHHLGLQRMCLDADIWTVNLYRSLIPGNANAFLPYLGHAFCNLSKSYQRVGDCHAALTAAENAVKAIDILRETHRELDVRALYSTALKDQALCLYKLKRYQDACRVYKELTANSIGETTQSLHGLSVTLFDFSVNVVYSFTALCNYVISLTVCGSHAEACIVIEFCLASLRNLQFPEKYIEDEHGLKLTVISHDILFSVSHVYTARNLRLSTMENLVGTFSELAGQHRGPSTSSVFIRVLFAYAHLCDFGEVVDDTIVPRQGDTRNPLKNAIFQVDDSGEECQWLLTELPLTFKRLCTPTLVEDAIHHYLQCEDLGSFYGAKVTCIFLAFPDESLLGLQGAAAVVRREFKDKGFDIINAIVSKMVRALPRTSVNDLSPELKLAIVGITRGLVQLLDVVDHAEDAEKLHDDQPYRNRRASTFSDVSNIMRRCRYYPEALAAIDRAILWDCNAHRLITRARCCIPLGLMEEMMIPVTQALDLCRGVPASREYRRLKMNWGRLIWDLKINNHANEAAQLEHEMYLLRDRLRDII